MINEIVQELKNSMRANVIIPESIVTSSSGNAMFVYNKTKNILERCHIAMGKIKVFKSIDSSTKQIKL